MRRVLLFDLDGTLIDSQPDIAAAFTHAVQALRPGHVIEPATLRPLIGRPLGVMAHELGLALAPSEERAFEDAYRAHFDALDCRHARTFEGVEGLLAALDDRVLAVVTGKIQYQASHVVRRMGLERRFRHVQGWRAGLNAKPAPDLLREALRALDVAPSEAAYVGDAPTDIEAAHAAGMESIAVTWGYGDRAALEASRPGAVAESPRDLRRLLVG